MLNLYRQLTDYPVFAHEGSIIPLDVADLPGNGGPNPNGYELIVVVGKDGRFCIVEDSRDDPVNAELGEEAYEERQIPITWTQAEGWLRIGPVTSDAGDGGSDYLKRYWKIRFLSCRGVELKDITIADFEAEAGMNRSLAGGCTVIVSNVPLSKQLVIQIGQNPQLDVLDIIEPIRSIINGLQCQFDIKDKLYECIEEDGLSIAARTSRLLAVGVDAEIAGPIFELLLADSRLQCEPQFQPCESKL